MKLYLLRHGKSPQLSEAGVARDEERPLAPEGREAVRRIAAFLKDQGGRPTRVLTSPLVRARETAHEAARVLKLREPEETADLDGRLPPEGLWRRLQGAVATEPETVLVGHQPQLGELVTFLTGATVEIKPGGIVALDFSEQRVGILWSKNPKDL